MAKKRPTQQAKGRRPMSDSHKEALAAGREQGLAVRRYLEALEATRPRRGRRGTPEGIHKRLAVITDAMVSANALAGPYSRRKRISYDAWRAAGVERRVLTAAGIGRAR